jgi:excisionase family DNA binding protein
MGVLENILAELRETRAQVQELSARLDGLATTPAPAEHMDIKQAASFLSLSQATIRKGCNQGRIPHYSAGKGAKLYFKRIELQAYMERGHRQTADAEAMHVMRGAHRRAS